MALTSLSVSFSVFMHNPPLLYRTCVHYYSNTGRPFTRADMNTSSCWHSVRKAFALLDETPLQFTHTVCRQNFNQPEFQVGTSLWTLFPRPLHSPILSPPPSSQYLCLPHQCLFSIPPHPPLSLSCMNFLAGPCWFNWCQTCSIDGGQAMTFGWFG